MKFKNIVFDLGGVIIDLAVDRTMQSFGILSGKSEEDIRLAYQQSPIFLAYEKGMIGDAQFRDEVRTIFGIQSSDSEIDRCWNAMLVDLPAKKLKLLDDLKNRFSTVVLSNTNTIHLNFINEQMLTHDTGKRVLDTYFHKAYYSHMLHMRKPESEIFQKVLDENGFVPGETILLDDNTDNIKEAQSLGLQTSLVVHPNQVYEIFGIL